MTAAANQEYVLKDGEVIITCTDPASHITYANEAFVVSSGYALTECMGKPQNLVRHPDMPKAAFADLWATIQSGEPWSGIVKNRRKDGGFYWVRANVTPVKEGGQIAGYVSVRVKPTPAEIEAASQIYAQMNAGTLAGRKLHKGEMIPTGILGFVHAVWRLPFAARTWLIAGLIVACFAVPAFASFFLPPETALALSRIASLAGIAVTIGFSAYLGAVVAKPVNEITAATTEALAGNLRVRYPVTGDPALRQLARYLTLLNEKTIGVVADTGASIDVVRASAHELDRGSTDMSSRTEEQAANLEETAATMEQIAAGIKQSSEGARNATRVADEATEAATRGGDAITRVNQTMDGITSTSRRIAEIISVIDGIAFQTNILALNAAVEAARAGEQGRGFAVVASEVRALAQRSATAAKEIKSLIDDSATRVDEGARLVGEATTTMDDIMAQVKRVTSYIGEIAHGTQEQAVGVSQVNEAVAQLDQVTQGNAAIVEQTAANASSLSAQADRLVASLGVLLKRS